MKKVELTDQDCLTIAALAARGARVVDVATRLGVARTTFDELRRRDERVERAWQVGRSELHQQLISRLIDMALKGNLVAVLFALKTVFAYREGETLDGDAARPLVQITLPGALPREAYAKMIELRPRVLAAEAEPSDA